MKTRVLKREYESQDLLDITTVSLVRDRLSARLWMCRINEWVDDHLADIYCEGDIKCSGFEALHIPLVRR